MVKHKLVRVYRCSGFALVPFLFGLIGCSGLKNGASDNSDTKRDTPPSAVAAENELDRPAAESVEEEKSVPPVGTVGLNLAIACDQPVVGDTEIKISCILRDPKLPNQKLTDILWHYKLTNLLGGSGVSVDVSLDAENQIDAIYYLRAPTQEILMQLLADVKIFANVAGQDLRPVEDQGALFQAFQNESIKASECGSRVFTQTIYTASTNYPGITPLVSYNVQAKGTLIFSGDVQNLEIESNIDTISVSPAIIKTTVMQEIAKMTGKRITSLQSGKSLACGVLAVNRIANTFGGYNTVVELSPAMPYLLSPTLGLTQFTADFAQSQTYKGISLRVVETNNKALAGHPGARGFVTIEPVAATDSLKDVDGTVIEISADYAYKIEFNFGNLQNLNAFGFDKATTYYIKDGKFSLIVRENPGERISVINYQMKVKK